MGTKPFNAKIVMITVVLTALCFGLATLLYSQGPRVRYVDFQGSINQKSLHNNASIRIVFDRPLEQLDYNNAITLSPEANFSVQTNIQNITLTFDENLLHGTEYTLNIDGVITDKQGKSMASDYAESFTTSLPRYAYLERDYSVEYVSTFTEINADDTVKIATLDGDSKDVFSHPEIRSFTANNDYVVAVTKTEISDELYTVNLDTGETRRETLPFEGSVKNLTLAANGRTLLYSIQPIFEETSIGAYEENSNRVESINLETGQSISLQYENGDYIKGVNIYTDNNGLAVIIQDPGQKFYAVSPFNDFNPVLIGSYTSSFGFNSDTTKIIFSDRNEFLFYDILTSEKSPLEFDVSSYAFSQAISAKGNDIFYSTTEYIGELTNSSVEYAASPDDEPEIAWSSTSASNPDLRRFNQSYDSKLLALQFNPQNCRFQSLSPFSDCVDSYQQIIDIESGDIAAEFIGTNFIWLP